MSDERLGKDLIIRHEDGYKDGYRVTIRDCPRHDNNQCIKNKAPCMDTFAWAPTNAQHFHMFKLWMEAEDFGYSGDGEYGYRWPWFYLTMIALGRYDETCRAIDHNGGGGKTRFEANVHEYIDDVRAMLNKLEEDVTQEAAQ